MTGFADFQGFLVSRVSCSTAGMVAYRSNPAEHLLWAFNARYRLRSWPTPCCCLSRYPVLCGKFRRAAQLGLSHRCRRHRCARRLASRCHRPACGARRQHHRRTAQHQLRQHRRTDTSPFRPLPGACSDRPSADHRLDHRHDIAVFSASRNGSDVNGRSCNTRLLCSGGTGTQRATVTEFAVLNGCGRHRLANSSPYPILIE